MIINFEMLNAQSQQNEIWTTGKSHLNGYTKYSTSGVSDFSFTHTLKILFLFR